MTCTVNGDFPGKFQGGQIVTVLWGWDIYGDSNLFCDLQRLLDYWFLQLP